MKPILMILATWSLLFSSIGHAASTLDGDQRLACEAIMCLASSQRPVECEPSIRRYFGIRLTRPGATVNARINFLRLCPRNDSNDTLVTTVANGAGSCEPENLNTLLLVTVSNGDNGSTSSVSNALPDYCVAFYGLQGLPSSGYPRYVGTPETGGYWVAASQYDAAYQAYLARMAATVPADQPGGGGGDGGQ